MEPFHKQLTPLLEGDAPSAPKLQAQRAVLSASTTIESRQYAGLTPQSALRSQSSALGRRAASAFTLIESVVAIGIFAFVIVGIVGLFGAALERQRQASFETRSVMASQQILARIRAAESKNNVAFTRGTGSNEVKLFHSANLTTPLPTNIIAFYYKQDGTEISGLTPVDNYESASYLPFTGYDADGRPQDIVGRARAILTTNGTGFSNLYRVTIEVSEPANLPLMAGTNFARKYRASFTTFATFPN